jgi:hypothetical protein
MEAWPNGFPSWTPRPKAPSGVLQFYDTLMRRSVDLPALARASVVRPPGNRLQALLAGRGLTFCGKRGGHPGATSPSDGTTTTASCDSGGEGLVATVHRIHAEPAGPTLAARPSQPAAYTRAPWLRCAQRLVPSGPAADLTEFNRAHIEVGEIATVLDLRFAEGPTSMRQTCVRGQLQ